MSQHTVISSDQSHLKKVADSFWQWRLEESPEFATLSNVSVFNNKLQSLSITAHEDRVNKCKNFVRELSQVKPENLVGDDKVTFNQLSEVLACVNDGFKWRHYGAYNAVNFLENVIVVWSTSILVGTRFCTLEDFQNYAERLRCIPKQTSEQIETMKAAIEAKTTSHAVSVVGVVEQYEEVLSKPVDDSVFCKPIKTALPKVEGLAENVKASLADEIRGVVMEHVFPALKEMRDFIQDTYLPQSRANYGVACLPSGLEYYRESLKWHLTTDMDPKDVHEVGLQEVSRIRHRMEEIKDQLKFSGSLNEFFQFMRNKEEFYVDSKEKLLEEYREIIFEHIDPKVRDVIDKVPDKNVQVQEMPFDGPGGQYLQPSTDGSRAGIFFANVNNPKGIPRFTMVPLCLHEASPGHHLQLSRQIEADIPGFRKEFNWLYMHAAPFHFPIYTSYIEGWALYAEMLGEEMGAYRNPYEVFGRLTEENFRAARLVVDTGLHAFKWSRDEAIDYMMKNTCLSQEDAKIEVDRYITWPGQACGYKIGELKIKELREKATTSLGKKFDLKSFHEVVLSSGAVSLHMLEKLVLEWVNRENEQL